VDCCKEIREAIHEAIADMETGSRSGLELGIRPVDEVLGSGANTSNVVIAAETSCGTSVLLAQVAAKVTADAAVAATRGSDAPLPPPKLMPALAKLSYDQPYAVNRFVPPLVYQSGEPALSVIACFVPPTGENVLFS
jgi:hypothetical protein